MCLGMLSIEMLVACWLKTGLIRTNDGGSLLYWRARLVENGGGGGEGTGHMEGEEGSKTESPKHGRASTKEQKKKNSRSPKEKSRTPLPPMCSGVIRSTLFSYYLTFRT